MDEGQRYLAWKQTSMALRQSIEENAKYCRMVSTRHMYKNRMWPKAPEGTYIDPQTGPKIIQQFFEEKRVNEQKQEHSTTSEIESIVGWFQGL